MDLTDSQAVSEGDDLEGQPGPDYSEQIDPDDLEVAPDSMLTEASTGLSIDTHIDAAIDADIDAVVDPDIDPAASSDEGISTSELAVSQLLDRPVEPIIYTLDDLAYQLRWLDGQPYSRYKKLVGAYASDRYTINVIYTQPDPAAPPSRVQLRVPMSVAGFPTELFSTPLRQIALADYLLRTFVDNIKRMAKAAAPSFQASPFYVAEPAQEILARTACRVSPDVIELNFGINLPEDHGVVDSRLAQAMFGRDLEALIESTLLYDYQNPEAIRLQIETIEDSEALRGQLAQQKLVAFIPNGAILPRLSPTNDLPPTGPNVIPFTSPPELEVSLNAPNRGKVVGMGIPQGVTLIVGGAFHGKSSLIDAIERGVYNHPPGDGRELLVCRAEAAKVQTEPGRPVERVDISAFLERLPFPKDTVGYTTESATGITSQAAAVMEALEAGSTLLMIDEDTSSPNFLWRDERQSRLVPSEAETVTPFDEYVRALTDELGVSVILAVGSTGSYFGLADTVIDVKEFRVSVVTEKAREIAREVPNARQIGDPSRLRIPAKRSLVLESLSPNRRGRVFIEPEGTTSLGFGNTTIDLHGLSGLIEAGQTRAIGDLIMFCLRRGYFESDTPIVDVLRRALIDVDSRGLEILSPHSNSTGDYSVPRLIEVFAALNRLHGLRAKRVGR